MLQDVRPGGEISVELKIHDSKTHFARYVNMADTTTTSRIEVAASYLSMSATLVHAIGW